MGFERSGVWIWDEEVEEKQWCKNGGDWLSAAAVSDFRHAADGGSRWLLVGVSVGANDQNDHNKEEVSCRRAHDITFHETLEEVQVILVVYIDDINLVGTPKELQKAIEYLKKEFEMKDLGKAKLCLGLQIQYLAGRIFIHQSAYTERVLKRFYMDKAHPLSTPMIVRSLEANKDPFRHPKEDEELFGPEAPYFSAIVAHMYHANATRPDITFSVNLLARYISSPTRRHWNEIKHILQYLKRTLNMGLFYANKGSVDLVSNANTSYLSDPHKARSQIGYVFTCGDNFPKEDYSFNTVEFYLQAADAERLQVTQ
ncbi:uncharacterized mitochondrial protein AtMg00810-like [Nicotiana sylvestris]|uniref:uncharacterized mitochondrial protein AtMg00810-like n=1 Tax=Nicotiana sylvestris TaxID=4096 RepID=UPI00388CBF37